MKPLTEKDVRYAVQFGRERILKTLVGGGREPVAFSLSGSGRQIPPKLASKVLSDPHMRPIEDGLFPGHSQQYEWRDNG